MNGTPVAVILAVADDESLVETLGTLPDPTAMAESGEAEEQMGNDEVHGEAELRCSRGPPRAGSPRTRVESASRCAAMRSARPALRTHARRIVGGWPVLPRFTPTSPRARGSPP